MVKFGKELEDKIKPEWRAHYIDYRGLKGLIEESAREAENRGQLSFSPRTTSLSVVKTSTQPEGAHERFFVKLDQEFTKVARFTQQKVEELRGALTALGRKAGTVTDAREKEAMLEEAKRQGDAYLALEKYVNVNYLGFHKVLKKHDKNVPHAPCRQFYLAYLHQQPWTQGNYSDLLVRLSDVYSKIRGDTSGEKNEDDAQGFVRSTTKYWVRTEDVSAVKNHVLQHLPVFQFDKDNFAGDAQLINSVYLDNQHMELYHGRLDKRPNAIALRIRWYGPGDPDTVFFERKTHRESWKGEESVKERFAIKHDKVIPFMAGTYTVADAVAELRLHGKSEAAIEAYAKIFVEVQQVIDSKQLQPLVRTQYMRTAFQIPFDATVRVSLDTNLVMLKETPEGDVPDFHVTGRWYRDPSAPIGRTEIYRFPHAVLEIKLSLAEGQQAPAWVQEMLASGYIQECHKFSKFIQGSASLYPDMVQAVPYWIDDESIRPSMQMCAPAEALSKVRRGEEGRPSRDKPRRRVDAADELQHPLLGDEPSVRMLPARDEIQGFRRAGLGPRDDTAASPPRKPSALFVWIANLLGWDTEANSERLPLRATPMRIEPKTFFANERTFLSWMHMSVTLGSIAAALLGFADNAKADPKEPVSGMTVELIALVLMPVAVAMCAYALFTFIWRAKLIARKQVGQFDDRVGPLALCGAVVGALTIILIINAVDFFSLLGEAEAKKHGGKAPPSMF